MDLMRHWGRRDLLVGEVSDSDSEFDNGILFTIQEGDDEDSHRIETGEDEDVNDEEYGNENKEDEDYDINDSNRKALYGDSDTETTVHDSTANSTTTTVNTSNHSLLPSDHSLLQISQPTYRMGSHNFIPDTATLSTTNGKYRTVSVFGGVLDLADPTDDDRDSISSDGFSDDDWSMEEELGQRLTRYSQSKSKTAPTERIEFKSEKARDSLNVQVQPDAQREADVNKAEPHSTSFTEEDLENLVGTIQEDSSEALPNQSLISKINEPTEDKSPSKHSPHNDSEQDKAADTFCAIFDIPKSVDSSLFVDNSVKERQRLLRRFLNELCFLPI